MLADDLGVEPDLELQHLYERIRRGEFENSLTPGSPQTADNDQGSVTDSLPLDGQRMPPSIERSLPSQPTSFIGREGDLAEIKSLLRQPDCRLLTLIGPGGIGKTRLAIEIAGQMTDEFAQGVVFVSLASLDSIELLAGTIAQELNFAVGGGDDTEQVLRYLQSREMLLVLDNYEHLLAFQAPTQADSARNKGAHSTAVYGEMIRRILSRAPKVKLLITSRERLNLQQEWLFTVEGLAYPRVNPVSEPLNYDAVSLFVDRLTQVHPGFTITNEAEAVVDICRLVGGMPLGLELAASWGRFMNCAEIVQEIIRGLDILETSLRNVPTRHRSIRAVMEYSWELLSEEERTALARLSVFRGSFTPAAAAEIAKEAGFGLLRDLLDKSLLRRRQQDGRYEIHELLRHFGIEKLAQLPDEPARTQQAHAIYYARFLQHHEPDLKGSKLQNALDEIAPEIDNIRLAWSWAIANRSVSFFQRAYFSMWLFRQFWGSEKEAEFSYRQAVEAFRNYPQTEPDANDANIVLGQLLIGPRLLPCTPPPTPGE